MFEQISPEKEMVIKHQSYLNSRSGTKLGIKRCVELVSGKKSFESISVGVCALSCRNEYQQRARMLTKHIK